jgi:hypothetical protein
MHTGSGQAEIKENDSIVVWSGHAEKVRKGTKHHSR